VAVEEDRVRLGLSVDVDADCLAVVVGFMLDLKRAAADAQSGIWAENENAQRGASAVLPWRERFFAIRWRPIAGLHEMAARVERECFPRGWSRDTGRVLAPGVVEGGDLLRGISIADEVGNAVVGNGSWGGIGRILGRKQR
jgi:hypothetical protein